MKHPNIPLPIVTVLLAAFSCLHSLPGRSTDVSISRQDDTLSVSIGKRDFFTYHGEVVLETGIDPVFARSGFIHPLRSPSGLVLTDAFPVGHLHQHAVFSAWTHAEYRGQTLDFWNQAKETGNARHREFLSIDEHGFRVRLEQVDADDQPVVEETWKIRIVPDDTYNIFDIQIHQEPATPDPVTLLTYHYGGFAFRGTRHWNREEAEEIFEGPMQILTNHGETNVEAANHSRCQWVAAYGKIEGNYAGVLIMNHPSSFRFPQPVRIHPEMPYFVFSPVVEGPFSLTEDHSYQAAYRVVTFDGQPDPERFRQLWQAYTDSSGTD